MRAWADAGVVELELEDSLAPIQPPPSAPEATWGAYTQNGLPSEEACARCRKICRVILCLEWQIAMARLQDPKDPLSQLWGDIDANLDAFEAGEDFPNPVPVPSAVRNSTSYVEEFSQECAFITEAECVKFVGATPTSLGYQLEHRFGVDGQTVLKGLHVQLRDLPATMSVGDILSLHKVKLSHVRNLSQDEFLLRPENQVHQTQAKAVRTSACSALVSQRAWHHKGVLALPTLRALKEKADGLEDSLASAAAGCGSGDTVDRKRTIDFSLGSLQDENPAGPAGSRKAQRKAKAKASAPGDTPRRSSRGSDKSNFGGSDKAATGAYSPEEAQEKLPGDVVLQKVCEALRKVPQCFQGLDPERHLRGEQLGRSMRAAGAREQLDVLNAQKSGQAYLLQKRLAVCESCSLLAANQHSLHNVPSEKLDECVRLITAENVPLPFAIEIALTKRACETAMEKVGKEWTLAGEKTMLDFVLNWLPDGEKKAEFNPKDPRFHALILQVARQCLEEAQMEAAELEEDPKTKEEKSFKAIADGMIEAVANNFLAALLELAPKNVHARKVLMEIAQILVQAVTTMPEADPELPEAISETLTSVLTFGRALLALLVPMPEYLGSSAKDVIKATTASKSKDQCVNPAYTLLKSALEDPWWRALATEVNVKAGINKELAPVLKKCTEDIKFTKGEDELNPLLTGALDTLNALPKLDGNLRAGATQHLRGHLKVVVDKITKAILAAPSVESLPISQVSDFVGKLACVSDDPAMCQQHLQLQAWQEKSKSQLDIADTVAFLAAAKEGNLDGSELDWERLQYHLSKFSKGFPEQCLPDLQELKGPIVRRLDNRAARLSLEFGVSV
ncbi:unnamed protein product [Symbiodinium sp. CCMP2592]|nr:unnamed protein product [Symbiodinium sp. CCMP2592]